MSEIRVTSVVGENGGDRVGLTTGLTVGPLTGTTGIGATITHQGHAQFAGVCTATNVSAASSVTATTFYGSGANLTGSGDYVKILKVVNTGDYGVQHLSFTNLDITTYKFFNLIGYFRPMEDAKEFRLRYRSGSNSLLSSSNYAYGFTVPYPTNNTGATSTSGQNTMILSTSVGNHSSEGIAIDMRVYFADSSDPTNATNLLNFVTWNGTYREQGNGFRGVTGTGHYYAAVNDLSGFTLYFSGGNMGDFSYCLYGMKR